LLPTGSFSTFFWQLNHLGIDVKLRLGDWAAYPYSRVHQQRNREENPNAVRANRTLI